MKKRLLFVAVLAIAMVPSFSREADAMEHCFAENYGSGQCGTTCVMYNDQGSAINWCTTLHGC